MVEPSWVGQRVSVRRVVERAEDGRLLFGDVVGDLVGLDTQAATIESRTGLVEVPLALVARSRLVPASTAQELALEAVAARGMRAVESEQSDGWLLRADHGFLRRANSALPLGQLTVPLDDMIDTARRWYAERDLPLLIGVPAEARRLLDAALGERGWDVAVQAHLMVARLDQLPAVAPERREVVVSDVPDDAWLSLYRGGEGGSPLGRALLARHDRVAFLTVTDGGSPVAIGRGVVDDGWLGVSGVEVAPDARRRGLASDVMARLWQWGRDHGADRTYLQVEIDNTAAVTLYDRLGYRVHHAYHYRVDPQTNS